MIEQLEDQQIIVKKLEATMAEQVEPYVYNGQDNAERLKKLESKVRDLNSASEDKRLQELEVSMQKVDEIIKKHTFYQTNERLTDLTEKVEELLKANEITTEVIGKLPLIARALEDLEQIEGQVGKLEQQVESMKPIEEQVNG